MSANTEQSTLAGTDQAIINYLQTEESSNVPVQIVQDGNEQAIYLPSQTIEVNGERHVIVSQAQDPETGEMLLVLQGENGEHIALPQDAFSSGLIQVASEDGLQMAVTQPTSNEEGIQIAVTQPTSNEENIQMAVMTQAETTENGIQMLVTPSTSVDGVQMAVVTQPNDSGLTLVADSNLTNLTLGQLEGDGTMVSTLITNIPNQNQTPAPTNVVQALETPRVTAQEEQSTTSKVINTENVDHIIDQDSLISDQTSRMSSNLRGHKARNQSVRTKPSVSSAGQTMLKSSPLPAKSVTPTVSTRKRAQSETISANKSGISANKTEISIVLIL